MKDTYIQEGDKFKYIIKVQNNTSIENIDAILEDELPEGISGINIKYSINGSEEMSSSVSKKAYINFGLNPGDELVAEIEVVADKLEEGKEEKEIKNVAKVTGTNVRESTSDEVVNIVKKKPEDNTDTPSNPEVPNDSNSPDNSGNPDDSKDQDDSSNPGNSNESSNPDDSNDSEDGEVKKYNISGMAWLDKNRNGSRDGGEDGLDGINVNLRKSNGEVVLDSDGNTKTSTTGHDGKYVFSDVEPGKYIILFEYDTNEYLITDYKKDGVSENLNSDAINANADSQNVGMTEIIEVEDSNIDNIDIGLIGGSKFDLKLDKYISRIVVENNKSTKVHSYNNEKLAKIEIDRKLVNDTIVKIEYKINVTNEGEMAGYAEEVIDYMPDGLEFDEELNENWYEENGNLICTSLAKTAINPGETKTLSLILIKKVLEDNLGTIVNTAEILQYTNLDMLEDVDSKAGNKNSKEDDMSTVSVILSINTGKKIEYIMLIIVNALILGVGIYFINKKVVT